MTHQIVFSCNRTNNEILKSINSTYDEPTRIPTSQQTSTTNPNESTRYQFGNITVNARIIFYKTNFTLAMVHFRSVVPGHVVIFPKRMVKKIFDLEAEEVADLYLTVQDVQKVLEGVHNATGSTITIQEQDVKDAAQTVEHAHVHVMPRKPNDFIFKESIHQMFAFHEEGGVPPRNESEMIKEADYLRQFFNSSGGFLPGETPPTTSEPMAHETIEIPTLQPETLSIITLSK